MKWTRLYSFQDAVRMTLVPKVTYDFPPVIFLHYKNLIMLQS